MSGFVGEVRGIWARLDAGQRLVVTSVLFAALVGLGAMFWYASQPEYISVYEGDRMREAHDTLTQQGIAVTAEGRELKVDRDEFDRAIAILNMDGFTGSTGSKGIDALSGMTLDRDSRLAALAEQQRLRAELSVRAIPDVLDVQVVAFKPKSRAFRDQDVSPSATASIRLAPGANFYLVAPHVASQVASATGVPREYVTVVDTETHRTWSVNENTGTDTNMNSFLMMQTEMSEERQRKAQRALDRVYPGLTHVMVRVELDPLWERGTDLLFPESPVLEQDRKVERKTENGALATGDPSVSNSAGQTARRIPTSTSKDTERDSKFDTKAGDRIWGLMSPNIKRITSAVFIDRSLQSAEPTILSILEPIIGRDAERGDPPTESLVADFPVPEPIDPEVASVPGMVTVVQGPGFMDFLREWGPTIGQVLGVLLVLWFLSSLLKRAAPAAPAVAAAGHARAVSPDEAEKQIRREIEKAIADDPAAISRLLEGWLTEQKA